MLQCSLKLTDHVRVCFNVSLIFLICADDDCKTNAGDDIVKGDVYNNTCSARFNSSLIKPSKIQLRWSSGENPLSSSVQSTDANNTVVLSYDGKASLPDVPEYNCILTLLAEQSSPATHDKKPHSLRCTLPSRKVMCEL